MGKSHQANGMTTLRTWATDRHAVAGVEKA